MSRIRRLMTGIAFGVAVAAGLAVGPAGGVGGPAMAAAEDPGLEQLAADAVIEECHISRAKAIEILRVQERSVGFGEQLRRRRPAVVGAYYGACRPGLIVQVLRRTPLAPLRRLARKHGVAKWTRFQRVRFTHRQTYRAQRVIDARLEALAGRCLVSTYQDTPGNGVGIDLSNDATPADVALVREAIGLTKVRVKLTRADGSLCLTVVPAVAKARVPGFAGVDPLA